MKEKLIVLHFVNTIRRGGAERQLKVLVENSKNIDNRVVSFYYDQNNYLKDVSDIEIINKGCFSGKFTRFYHIATEVKPDIVFAWGPLPYLVALICSPILKYKVINGSIRHGIFRLTIRNFFRLVMLHLSTTVVANSQAGLKANRLKRGIVLYNGIDERFNRNSIGQNREENGIVKLISVANLVPAKDYGTVFKALKILGEQGISFHYNVLGNGPLRSKLENLVTDLGLKDKISFLGNVPEPERYLSSADIFIHSSRGEGCPNAVLEAMYMGLPLIVTPTGGTSEVLEDNARIFQLGDYNQLAQEIKDLIKSREERRVMGERSYTIVQNRFTAARMVGDYERIIRAVSKNEPDQISDLVYQMR